MKKNWIASGYVYLTVCLLGGLGCLLRWWLHATALDQRGLLTKGHPLEWLVWGVTAVGLAFFALWARGRGGSEEYADNFPGASYPAAVGSGLFAVGIACTLLLREPLQAGVVGLIWQMLGWAAILALVAVGLARARGAKPHSLLHGVLCLSLVAYVLDHYQTWCANPQLMDDVFSLLAVVAMLCFSYYLAAAEAGVGKRRMALFTGLLSGYLCLVNLSCGEDPYLYLGGGIWALTNLCSLEPKPVSPAEKLRTADRAGEEGET